MTSFWNTNLYHKYFAVFSPCIGKCVRSLARDQYFFNGVATTEEDASLEITFNNGHAITLCIANDGQSVMANTMAMPIQAPFTIDEGARCEWQRIVIDAVVPWCALSGCRLSAVDTMVEQWTSNSDTLSSAVAWLFHFDENYLCYYNCGDNGRMLFNRKPNFGDTKITIECVAPDLPD